MLPQGNFQITNNQLFQENIELKQKLENLQLEYEKQIILSKETQEWKDKYDRISKQNNSLNEEKKQLQDEINKQNDEIKNLEISVKQLQVKISELNNYEQIKSNSIRVQQNNIELQRELEVFKQKAQFIIKSKIIVDNMKQFYQLSLEWDKNIQNLQLEYRQENDSLLFEGYGENGDKKIVYQQIHYLEKKTLQQNQKPSISLKQSQMILTFEV